MAEEKSERDALRERFRTALNAGRTNRNLDYLLAGGDMAELKKDLMLGVPRSNPADGAHPGEWFETAKRKFQAMRQQLRLRGMLEKDCVTVKEKEPYLKRPSTRARRRALKGPGISM